MSLSKFIIESVTKSAFVIVLLAWLTVITVLMAQEHEKVNHLKESLRGLKEKLMPNSSCIGKLTNIYNITITGKDFFPVSCDSTLAGPGWTVIQRRIDGSVNFTQSWAEYVQGFGNLRSEFWIGLEKLHLLTNHQPHELYIYLMNNQGEIRFARYSEFIIGNNAESYKLTLGSYFGNAGDSFNVDRDMKFSTPDKDNDDDDSSNCALSHEAGWWFNHCSNSNLNGVYNSSGEAEIYWSGFYSYRLNFIQMMIRPKQN